MPALRRRPCLGRRWGGVVFRVARDGAALEVGFRCEEVHALDGVLGAFAVGNVSDGTEMQRTPSEGEGLFLEVGVCKMLEHGSLPFREEAGLRRPL